MTTPLIIEQTQPTGAYKMLETFFIINDIIIIKV